MHVEKLKKMESRKIAPMAVYLVSDAAKEVTGQIFGVRANEIMLFSQPRPIRSVHHTPEWTPEAIAEIAVPVNAEILLPARALAGRGVAGTRSRRCRAKRADREPARR